MNVADKICEKARNLPEPLAKEVLEFIEQISAQPDYETDLGKQKR